MTDGTMDGNPLCLKASSPIQITVSGNVFLSLSGTTCPVTKDTP